MFPSAVQTHRVRIGSETTAEVAACKVTQGAPASHLCRVALGSQSPQHLARPFSPAGASGAAILQAMASLGHLFNIEGERGACVSFSRKHLSCLSCPDPNPVPEGEAGPVLRGGAHA